MERIKIAQWKEILAIYMPLYVAIEEGFFKQNGLQVQLIQVGNDDDVFRYVSSAKADFGVSDPTFCALPQNAKYKPKVVASIVDRVAAYGITLNPVLQTVRNIEDLVNVRIGTYPAPSTIHSIIAATKNSNKRLLQSLEIIQGPIGKQLKQLRAGQCDIVMDIEPFVSIAESQGCRVVFDLAEFHGPFCTTGFYTLQSYIDSNSEIVQAAISAITEALVALSHDRKLADRVIKKLYPTLSDKIIKNSLKRLYTSQSWREDARTMESSWRTAIEARKKVGQKFIHFPYSVVDNSFAEHAWAANQACRLIDKGFNLGGRPLSREKCHQRS